jgi:hypothetical protein
MDQMAGPNTRSQWYHANMRTLVTQVKLRRLTRAVDEATDRLLSEPAELEMAGLVAARLLKLVDGLAEAWDAERHAASDGPAAWDHYLNGALQTIRFAVAGIGQEGADIRLLAVDFTEAALPLEVFLKGLDHAPALLRIA